MDGAPTPTTSAIIQNVRPPCQWQGGLFVCLINKFLVLEHRTQGGVVVPLRSPAFPLPLRPRQPPLAFAAAPAGGSSNPLEHCPSVLISYHAKASCQWWLCHFFASKSKPLTAGFKAWYLEITDGANCQEGVLSARADGGIGETPTRKPPEWRTYTLQAMSCICRGFWKQSEE